VFRISEHTALVQTVDFFTPVVDDPYTFGAIAAANALSDVYAMGGTPITAMGIACFPDEADKLDILASIMLGGAEKLAEAGVALIGGHTICDQEIKFGYAVTGIVDTEGIMTNAGALPGDSLIITKPLGIGVITTAIKRGLADAETVERVVALMTALNGPAARALSPFRVHAVTDVTGYGLLGHGCELAEASRVTLRLQAAAVPFLPAALGLAEAGILPGLVAKTWKQLEKNVVIGGTVSEAVRNLMIDPQTSGGLLVSVHAGDREPLMQELLKNGVHAAVIGTVEPAGPHRIVVE
jgi:selenide, water dikinase